MSTNFSRGYVNGCIKMTDSRRNKGIRRKALDLIAGARFLSGMPLSRTSRSRTRLFGSPLLEAFTVISAPAFFALWAVVLPAILFFAVRDAPTLWAPLLMIAGILGWTVTEYALHRFAFHFEARSAILRRFIFIIHGNHHAFPNDPLRNLMPPIVSLSVGALVWAMCVSVMGSWGTWSFFGFMLGYVGYDAVHYACHQWPMKGRLARMLKVHHMRHHHGQAGGNYAITGMVWDRILATRISVGRGKA